jgi:hypothetical protein
MGQKKCPAKKTARPKKTARIAPDGIAKFCQLPGRLYAIPLKSPEPSAFVRSIWSPFLIADKAGLCNCN